MSPNCKECGVELPLDTPSSYCQKCDNFLDNDFFNAQEEIIRKKVISSNQIKFLKKFDKDEVSDLYSIIKNAFLEEDGIGKDEMKLLIKLQDAFDIDENLIRIDTKPTCPTCGKKLKKDDRFCAKCGFDTEKSEQKQNPTDKIQEVGKKMSSIGKTLTIFITLPILIIFLIYLFYSCGR